MGVRTCAAPTISAELKSGTDCDTVEHMKNVTIALDDATHRAARIRAAELGTSLSALVKTYLQDLVAGTPPAGVREMSQPFQAEPAAPPPKLPPRVLGQMKGEIWYANDWDEWPEDILKMLNGENPDDPLNW